MKQHRLLIPLILLALSACESTDNEKGNTPYVMFFIVILIIIIAALVYHNELQHKEKISKESKIKLHFELTEAFAVKCEKFIGGHPDIDEAIINTWLVPNDKEIIIQWCTPDADNLYTGAVSIATIPTNQVNAIKIEDASTIENKITLGRFIMLGVLAFAYRKKIKSETAYLIIEWNDGRFEHETTFEFSAKGAFQSANHARNRLIKLTRTSAIS